MKATHSILILLTITERGLGNYDDEESAACRRFNPPRGDRASRADCDRGRQGPRGRAAGAFELAEWEGNAYERDGLEGREGVWSKDGTPDANAACVRFGSGAQVGSW